MLSLTAMEHTPFDLWMLQTLFKDGVSFTYAGWKHVCREALIIYLF
jgi:hypothetical protein